MSQADQLTSFYQTVQTAGRLRTTAHARRWTQAVLQTLGTFLPRGVKRELARSLPKELGGDLTDVFWLLHFPDRNVLAQEFQRRVALRAGNTDLHFAYYPTRAVFAALQPLLTSDLRRRVGEALSPEVRVIWEQAQHEIVAA